MKRRKPGKMSFAKALIRVLRRTKIPAFYHGMEPTVTYDHDGWEIDVFYDCEEFDYIERMVDPEGNIYDPWDDVDLTALQYYIPPFTFNQLQAHKAEVKRKQNMFLARNEEFEKWGRFLS